MYIDKKSLPKTIAEEIDIRSLTKSLKQADAEYGNYEHDINYDNKYLLTLELTYDYHKTRGTKWKVTDYKYIYKVEEDGRIIIC